MDFLEQDKIIFNEAIASFKNDGFWDDLKAMVNNEKSKTSALIEKLANVKIQFINGKIGKTDAENELVKLGVPVGKASKTVLSWTAKQKNVN